MSNIISYKFRRSLDDKLCYEMRVNSKFYCFIEYDLKNHNIESKRKLSEEDKKIINKMVLNHNNFIDDFKKNSIEVVLPGYKFYLKHNDKTLYDIMAINEHYQEEFQELCEVRYNVFPEIIYFIKPWAQKRYKELLFKKLDSIKDRRLVFCFNLLYFFVNSKELEYFSKLDNMLYIPRIACEDVIVDKSTITDEFYNIFKLSGFSLLHRPAIACANLNATRNYYILRLKDKTIIDAAVLKNNKIYSCDFIINLIKEKYIKSLTENGYTKEEEAAILKAAEDQGEDISFERYLKYYGGNK